MSNKADCKTCIFGDCDWCSNNNHIELETVTDHKGTRHRKCYHLCVEVNKSYNCKYHKLR